MVFQFDNNDSAQTESNNDFIRQLNTQLTDWEKRDVS